MPTLNGLIIKPQPKEPDPLFDPTQNLSPEDQKRFWQDMDPSSWAGRWKNLYCEPTETDPHKKRELSQFAMLLLMEKANGVKLSPLREAEIRWETYLRDVEIYNDWKKGQ